MPPEYFSSIREGTHIPEREHPSDTRRRSRRQLLPVEAVELDPRADDRAVRAGFTQSVPDAGTSGAGGVLR